MPTSQEIHRLRQVYRGYRESGIAQARWAETNPGNRAATLEWTRLLGEMLRAADLLPLTDRRILEVGCGTGDTLARFTCWGALPHNLQGVDLLPDRVEEARRRHPEIQFGSANAEELVFPDDSFDLVLLFTVLTSILH